MGQKQGIQKKEEIKELKRTQGNTFIECLNYHSVQYTQG